MRPRLQERFIHGKQAIRRRSYTVVAPDTIVSAPPESFGRLAVAPHRMKSLREPLGVVGLHEHPAAGLLDDLRERAAARLDHRNAARHGFEQEHSLRLVVCRRDRKHIEALQKRQLALAVHDAVIGKLVS